jgi:hypothetical protein
LWCGTYLSLTVWSVCSLMLGKLNSCFGMSNGRGMERSDILLMVDSGNIFDLRHEDFSNDPRNIRFGLSTDGMNPFGEMRNPHNTWLVIMCIYNLRPWLCHKRKYLLFTTLVSSAKWVGIDIDVFLEPLMEDMQMLWEYGINVWDEHKKEHFNLKAIIFYMINDNPARLALTGQAKGRHDVPFTWIRWNQFIFYLHVS